MSLIRDDVVVSTDMVYERPTVNWFLYTTFLDLFV